MYSHKILAELSPYINDVPARPQAAQAARPDRPNLGAARPGMQMPQNMGFFGGQGMRIG